MVTIGFTCCNFRVMIFTVKSTGEILVWKPVPGFEGRYSVSDQGEVRRDVKMWSKPAYGLLKPQADRNGYMFVYLTAEGERKGRCFTVHGLVLLAHVGERPSGCEVDHIDGNPRNNHVENLRYLPHRENVQRSYDRIDKRRHIPRGEASGMSKLKDHMIPVIRQWHTDGVSLRKIAHLIKAEYGINVSYPTVRDAVRRKTWQHIP
ncbi:MAG: hypothetical protein HC892_00060 [Saprospiraceae bacterium]|nr:hypothetical protein [Saprospiraceae bacterium]